MLHGLKEPHSRRLFYTRSLVGHWCTGLRRRVPRPRATYRVEARRSWRGTSVRLRARAWQRPARGHRHGRGSIGPLSPKDIKNASAKPTCSRRSRQGCPPRASTRIFNCVACGVKQQLKHAVVVSGAKVGARKRRRRADVEDVQPRLLLVGSLRPSA